MAIGNKVKGITIEFNGETTKLGRAVNEINKKTRDLDSQLKSVDKALKFNPSNTELLAQKQTLLGRKVEETKNKLTALKEAQAKLDDDPAVDKTSQDYMELRREIIETESKLKHFEKQLRDLGNVKLTALGTEMKQIGSKMQNAGKQVSMYVTAPLVGAGTVAVKKFAEVDKTMQLTNATMKNSQAQADLLNEAMKKAAANSTYGMDEAATATLNFARAGLTAEEAADALAPAMNLAAGEGGNLEVVSSGLVATINGFGDSFDKAEKYADVFANACNNSALDIDSLSEAMSVAAPIFSAAGYSVNDAALYMGVMANNGIEASVAANALKTGMARLVEPSKQGAEWMDNLGISITNADGTMKDSVQVQSELHDAFSTLSESEQVAAASAIFGKNQMSNWLALINTAPKDVETLNTQLGETGTTSEMAEKMMGGFGGSLEKIKSSLDVAATSLGEALAPMIAKAAEWIQKLVDWFNNLSPSAQRVIGVVMAITAAIGPLLVVSGILLSSIGQFLITGPKIISMFGAIGNASKILSGILSATPWMIVAAAAIAAIILIVKNWDKIKEFFSKLWDAVKEIFTKAFEGIKLIITTYINIWKTIITTIFNAIKAYFLFIFNVYKTIFTTAFNAIKTVVTTVLNGIKKFITGVWNGIKTATSTVWEKIKNAIVTPIEKARDIIKKIIEKIKGFFNFDFKLPKIKLPHFSISPKGWKLGDLLEGSIPSLGIDWYAKGGIFRTPSVIGVGEKGPEAVLPIEKLNEMMIGMADSIVNGIGQTMALQAAGQSGEITIPIYLYPSGPKMGEETVKMYDTYKRILG